MGCECRFGSARLDETRNAQHVLSIRLSHRSDRLLALALVSGNVQKRSVQQYRRGTRLFFVKIENPIEFRM